MQMASLREGKLQTKDDVSAITLFGIPQPTQVNPEQENMGEMHWIEYKRENIELVKAHRQEDDRVRVCFTSWPGF
jgi:hypothetical protein